MEDIKEDPNIMDSYSLELRLHKNSNLKSLTLPKKYSVEIKYSEYLFTIKATPILIKGNLAEDYFEISLSLDNIRDMNGDFSHYITDFSDFFSLLVIASKQDKLICYSKENEKNSLVLKMFYTIFYDQKDASFDLDYHGKLSDKEAIQQYYGESPAPDYLNIGDKRMFKGEIVNYEKDFKEYDDDYEVINFVLKNIGNSTWEPGEIGLKCNDAFSSVICEEIVIQEEVIPGDEINLEMKFKKGQNKLQDGKIFCYVCLCVRGEPIENEMLLDFLNSFNEEELKNDEEERKRQLEREKALEKEKKREKEIERLRQMEIREREKAKEKASYDNRFSLKKIPPEQKAKTNANFAGISVKDKIRMLNARVAKKK